MNQYWVCCSKRIVLVETVSGLSKSILPMYLRFPVTTAIKNDDVTKFLIIDTRGSTVSLSDLVHREPPRELPSYSFLNSMPADKDGVPKSITSWKWHYHFHLKSLNDWVEKNPLCWLGTFTLLCFIREK